MMSSLQIWIQATRPKTLPAAIIPVALASALAYANHSFVFSAAIVALICAMLIQVATNFINEVYDFRKGADTQERLGPTRAVAAGLIPEKHMIIASAIVILATFLLGLYLVSLTGIEILIVGLISLFFAWAYTGGPYPLAYKGLGDIFVFVFFGVTAVCGTYYVQALEVIPEAWILAIAPGALSANILGVNNIRDIHTDRKAQKYTLAVHLGIARARIMYYLLTALAYAVPIALVAMGHSLWSLLPLATLPLSLRLVYDIKNKQGPELNATLAGTAKLLALYGIAMLIGLVIPVWLA